MYPRVHCSTIAKTRKHPECQSAEERIKKTWRIYSVREYSAIIKKETRPFVATLDGPRGYHTKWSKSEREIQLPHASTYMWSLKHDTRERGYMYTYDCRTNTVKQLHFN